MLFHADLSDEFWSLAVLCATYIRNRCFTRAVADMTPYEAWTGHKPSLSHLRVFGCSAYVHVSKRHRTKLDPKAVLWILVGYPAGSKAYQFWNPVTGTRHLSGCHIP